jgi:hypothetical protein
MSQAAAAGSKRARDDDNDADLKIVSLAKKPRHAGEAPAPTPALPQQWVFQTRDVTFLWDPATARDPMAAVRAMEAAFAAGGWTATLTWLTSSNDAPCEALAGWKREELGVLKRLDSDRFAGNVRFFKWDDN